MAITFLIELRFKFVHLIGVNDGSEQTLSFTPECRTETFWSSDQQSDHQVGVLFHTFTYTS